ncbi:MAG: efflux RND transporter periplasmic adaptor subunit [Myxococcota bacterium]
MKRHIKAPSFFLVVVGLLLLAPACNDTSSNPASTAGASESEHSDHPSPSGQTTSHGSADPSDWCGGHGVPESMCTVCNPGLVERFQREGDWCQEHGFPESVCPVCNPMQPPSEAGGHPRGSAADWCGGHGVPESMCTVCNPGLVERFQREGDWCQEHGFPESVCPVCNPMQPPDESGDRAPANASDWCSEHGLPESMCTQCNPSLAAGYRDAGDWCGEHEFPESVCPVCNPVTPPPGASGPQTRVQLTETAFRTSGIRLEQVSSRHVSSDGTRVPAEIQFDPDRLAHISPLVDGQIVSVSVTIGDRVESGDELATFRSVELGQARAELSRASAVRETAEANLERQRRLRDEGISSERSLLEAQQAFDEADAARDAARSRLRVFGVRGGSGSDMALTSPISGVVVERHATRGENVSTEDTLFVVADVSEVWVIARAYEQHIPLARVGMGASLTVGSHPERQWTGSVDYVALSLDESSRTLPIRVSVPNSDGALRPGMFGTLTIAGGEGAAGLSVPVSAVQSLNGGDIVFVQGDAERTFEARTVVLGRESEARFAVLEGLSGTENVVVGGAFILKSELVRGQLADGCAGD